MIKYYVNEGKRQVIGVLDGTKYDVVNKIDKILDGTSFCYINDKCLMPDSFRTVVTCDPADEFDVKTGKDKVKERIMNRYYKSFDKRLDIFIDDVNSLWGQFFEA